MRLFIAIWLPEEWKQVLANVEASIGWLGRGIRWAEPTGMHLTLRFLGDVSEAQVPEVETGIKNACASIAPFTMRIKGTGVFPAPNKPRLYWAGLQAPQGLMELQSRMEIEMETLGFPREDQSFKPHLTLARIKDPNGKSRMTDALLSYKLESAPMLVQEALLMRSHLSSDGARYETIFRHKLSE